jgi:hypothetical protein
MIDPWGPSYSCICQATAHEMNTLHRLTVAGEALALINSTQSA